MTEKESTLIRLLAQTDAIFRPLRLMDWNVPGPGNLWEARQQFKVSGVQINSGGGQADRKSIQRLLDVLVSDGLLIKSGSGKSAGFKLSDAGETRSRSLCGLPSLADSHRYLIKVIDLERETDHGCLTPEYLLLGATNYEQTDDFTVRIFDLEMFLLPALVHGWLDARSDLHGRTYFSAKALGQQIATSFPPSSPANLPSYDDAANDLYLSTRRKYREELRTAKPKNPSEIGDCPLPCSIAFHPRKPQEEIADVATA